MFLSNEVRKNEDRVYLVFVNLYIELKTISKGEACRYQCRLRLDKLFSFDNRHRVEIVLNQKHLEMKLFETATDPLCRHATPFCHCISL